jgi:hypothetical protein
MPGALMNRRGKNSWRLAVPESMCYKILEIGHDQILAAHCGIKKTYEKLSIKYHWHGMYEDVKRWVERCIDCAMRKGYPSKKTKMISIIANRPMQILGADILGPLPRTKNGNRFILVFTDHFTKWVETFALVEAKEKDIAKCFVEEIICRHGAPEQLLTDRGKVFTSRIMAEIRAELDIKGINTSGYRPQTNGLTERFNKTLTTMLSMYVSGHQRDWDTLLPFVTFAYRNTQQGSTGETPFYLMHLRDPNIPGEWNEVDEFINTERYKADMLSKQQKIMEEVTKWNELIRQKRENAVKGSWTIDQFKEGDLVWLFSYRKKKGLSKKLMMAWHGPFRISRLVPPLNVELQNQNGAKFKQLIHISRIKLYKGAERPREYLQTEPYPEELEPPMEPELKGEFEIEDILAHRKRHHGTEYLIRWKGYEKESDTWEPEENLFHSKEMLEQYKRRESLLNVSSWESSTRNGKRRILQQDRKRTWSRSKV